MRQRAGDDELEKRLARRKVALWILFWMIWLMPGCGVNRLGLHQDMARLLKRHGVETSTLDCRMGLGRDGRCLVDVSADKVAQLAHQLELREWPKVTQYASAEAYQTAQLAAIERMTKEELQQSTPPEPPELSMFRAHGWFHDGSLSERSFRALSEVTVYGRSARLALDGGGAFDFVVLFYSSAAQRACMDIAYAYG